MIIVLYLFLTYEIQNCNAFATLHSQSVSNTALRSYFYPEEDFRYGPDFPYERMDIAYDRAYDDALTFAPDYPLSDSRGDTFETWSDSSGSRASMSQNIQGNTRRTFKPNYESEVSEIVMETGGRPLNAEFELWDGPNNTPTKMKVYSEDGNTRPFVARVRTPNSRSGRNVMSFKNSGRLETPFSGGVGPVRPRDPYAPAPLERMGYNNFPEGDDYIDTSFMVTIQGNSLKTWTLENDVESVEVIIVSDGNPMYTNVELWGADGHNKQIAEIYNDDGYNRPFSAIVETPGTANTICVKNTGPIEYPVRAKVVPQYGFRRPNRGNQYYY